MPEIKTLAGGLKKEVVRAYQKTAIGCTVPSAHDDPFGGRPDLDAETRLPPPVDDPTWGAVGETSEPLLRPTAAAKEATTGAVARVPSPARPAPGGAMPDPYDYQEKPMTASQSAAAAPQHSAADNAERVTELLEGLVSHPSIRALLPGASKSQRLPDTGGPGTTHVQVTMEGEFGRFRSKVADVVICDTHVALVYTNLVGDEDLAYEPPLGKTFVLSVPLTDGKHRQVYVQHLGLVTRLESLNNAVVVVLPMASAPESSDEEG